LKCWFTQLATKKNTYIFDYVSIDYQLFSSTFLCQLAGKLKEIGLIYWQSPNTDATNETGFGALPGGYRSMVGTFGEIHQYSPFWSTTEGSLTEAKFWTVGYQESSLFSNSFPKHNGYAIRCLKD